MGKTRDAFNILVITRERIHLQCRRPGFGPWVGKILWRRPWEPTPVCLPGESHGLRGLAGCHPRGLKESDMSEQLSTEQHKGVLRLFPGL